MEAKYVDNLVNKVKFAGFGDAFENEIRERIAKNEPSFDLHYQPNFKHNTEAVAHITRDEQKNDYYFNTYDVVLKKEGIDPLKQTVYTENPLKDNSGQWVNSTITLKEAYNMMDVDAKGYGRAVLKDFVNKDNGVKSQSWIRFDFTRKNTSGNYPVVKKDSFDLDTHLMNSKIKDMDDPHVRKGLIDKLAKGNEVTVMDAGVIKGIVVNPQFQNTKFVPASYGKNANEQKQGEANSETQNQSNDASQNQKDGAETAASQAAPNVSGEQKDGQVNSPVQPEQPGEANAASASQAIVNEAMQDQNNGMENTSQGTSNVSDEPKDVQPNISVPAEQQAEANTASQTNANGAGQNQKNGAEDTISRTVTNNASPDQKPGTENSATQSRTNNATTDKSPTTENAISPNTAKENSQNHKDTPSASQKINAKNKVRTVNKRNTGKRSRISH